MTKKQSRTTQEAKKKEKEAMAGIDDSEEGSEAPDTIPEDATPVMVAGKRVIQLPQANAQDSNELKSALERIAAMEAENNRIKFHAEQAKRHVERSMRLSGADTETLKFALETIMIELSHI